MLSTLPLDTNSDRLPDVGRSLGKLHSDAPKIVIGEKVLAAAIEFCETDCRRERGGFLIGGVRDERRICDVRHFLPAVATRSQAASLTFTHDTWAAMTREIAERFPGEVVVGWQHSHPGFGVFLSGYDRFIHRHFFRQPWQIALVIDPVQQHLGFFQWRGGEIVGCGFVCSAE